MSNSDKDKKELLPYFDMEQAWDDVLFGENAKEKAIAGLKFLGKGLFNTGKFAVKSAPKVAETFATTNANIASNNIKEIDKRLKDNSLSDNERFALEENRLRSEMLKTKSEEVLEKLKEKN